MSDKIINFNPNLNYNGHCADKTVCLTFGSWEFRLSKTVIIGGNCSGLENIEAAIGRVYDEACEAGNGRPRITMTRARDGEILLCDDDEEQGEDWLKDMLISAEITDIQPEAHKKAGGAA